MAQNQKQECIMGVWVVLLILVLLLCKFKCEGCLEKERNALLELEANFFNNFTASNWETETDCCEWERVECNSTTKRVIHLNLYNVREAGYGGYRDAFGIQPWYLNLSSFLAFEDLKTLNLSFNGLDGYLKNEGFERLSSRLIKLEVLDLSSNYFNDTILSSLSVLSSLKSLYLGHNFLTEASAPSFKRLSSKSRSLEVLDLNWNGFSGSVLLSSLGGFSSLKILILSSNSLESTIHSQGIESASWIDLEVLDLSSNNFNDSTVSSLSGLSSLESLNFAYNQLTERSVPSLERLASQLTYLEVLDLSGNNLTNIILSSLGGFSYLKSLTLADTGLEGTIDIQGLIALNKLEMLDLSLNNVDSFVVPKEIINVSVLNLDALHLNGSTLRKSLRAFTSVAKLSLQSNEFKGIAVAGDFRNLANLEEMVLDSSSNLGNNFFESIGTLTTLKILSMVGCEINGTLHTTGWSKLKNLEELNLRYNDFEGTLPPSFGNLTALRKLDLSINHFTGNFSSNLGNMPSLEILDLSENNFTEHITSNVVSMPSLWKLDLSQNYFTGNISCVVAGLKSLVYLDFSRNQFQVPTTFAFLANHSYLNFIYGDGNTLIPDTVPTFRNWVPKFQLKEFTLSSPVETNRTDLVLPNFLVFQYNLTRVDFTDCKFKGEFPNWLLENNTKMTELSLRSCSFTGQFRLPSHSNPSITKIDVSDNDIQGEVPANISSTFANLQLLDMSTNAFHGSLPNSFDHMNSLRTLDLSNNHLSGEILWNTFVGNCRLSLLVLSNNNLDGQVFPALSTLSSLEQLYLNDNDFVFPQSISNTSFLTLSVLDIRNNHLVGKLPRWIGNLSNLQVISMSSNNLEGFIPMELCKLERLEYLDISENDLTGFIPPNCINSSFLKYVHLGKNRLNGIATTKFSGQSSLVTLDLGDNDIIGRIPDWIGNLSALNILILKNNSFMGWIPNQLCLMTELTIIDLSHNSLSGPIPYCLTNISFKTDSEGGSSLLKELTFLGRYKAVTTSLLNLEEQVEFTTKRRSYTYKGNILAFMTGIDFSHNKLVGKIPHELGNLTEIRALNLSHNNLTGHIPFTFSNLKQIESLDLSFNNLNGGIPPQLTELTTLAVFSVAHNNLSGKTPDRNGQFLTFEESSYEGNPFLCGPPLNSCYDVKKTPAIVSNTGDGEGEEDGGFIDIDVFYISFTVSYISLLLGVAAVLYINPYWRQAWFYLVELVMSTCYYFVVDSVHKVFKIRN